ncbi:pisatin demethylase [Leptodontidium sp. MPI-SDFR-AT-0119]|nr:pisatin demethylase [Leptodontidium sp. MPI-SDFR-AT-0119]
MLLHFVTASGAYVLVGFLVGLALCRGAYNRYGRGLNHIPGPFLASVTNWWRFFVVWGRRPELTHIRLHEQYGDVVRIGPATVIVRNPEGVKKIYALNAGYIKSDFYPVQEMVFGGKVMKGFFTTQDDSFHARIRRVVANAYAMSTLVQFEPLVDSTITAFIQQLDKYAVKAGEEGILDFGVWLQWYAFDVIGELTFSKRLGFLDEARDVDRIIEKNENLLDYFAVIGQVPWLDHWLLKNPIRLWATGRGLIDVTVPVAIFAKQRITERLALLEKQGGHQEDSEESEVIDKSGRQKRRDFLSRFLESKEKNPTVMDDRRVTAFCSLNMFAGSDTTGISLRAVFYLLLKHPHKMARLMKEINDPQFTPEDEFVSWTATQKMTYLCAVIQESLRLHPAVGLPLERIVPASGLVVEDLAIPPGTIVGTTAWGLHYNKSVFGPDADVFRPERWIDSPKEQLALMTSMMFSFGMGSRTCLGKNISLLEMHKLVPALLRRYKFYFAREDTEWNIHNAWFIRQTGFEVRIKSRS